MTYKKFLKFSFNYQSAGFSTPEMMPFGFFLNSCKISAENDPSKYMYLIGSEDDSKAKKCSTDFQGLQIVRDSATWSASNLTLEWRAFMFVGITDLTLSCSLELCLSAECDALAIQTC
jgi:hypothetical protein